MPLLLCSFVVADSPKKPEEKPPEPITDKHFSIYDAKGNPTTLDALVERLQSASVVFIGENHDDPVAHHLEHLLLKRLHEQLEIPYFYVEWRQALAALELG